jgi:hypothetical protein
VRIYKVETAQLLAAEVAVYHTAALERDDRRKVQLFLRLPPPGSRQVPVARRAPRARARARLSALGVVQPRTAAQLDVDVGVVSADTKMVSL